MKSRSGARRRRRPIIALDGPAGAGKTTTAREVARRLNFLHVDTGALYRAVALGVLQAGCSLDQPEQIAAIAQQIHVDLRYEAGEQRVLLDGKDVTDQLRTTEVTKAVTPVCEVPEVRRRLVQMQRKLGQGGGIVMEGRDIGTVVFPDAELKVFLVADLDERARRRLQDLKAAGVHSNFSDLLRDLERRDGRDQNRADSPLKPAADAILLDTTHLTFQQQVEAILRHVASLGPRRRNEVQL